jgi:hypothetical protein
MGLDLNFDYNSVQNKINATKSYTDLKGQYDDTTKKAGESFDKAKSDITGQIQNLKNQSKRYQKEIKSQLEQLLDINKITGGKGGNSTKLVKRLFLTALKNIEPKIAKILSEEALNAVGCDQQQSFSAQTIYIKVKSIDLLNLLKLSPTEDDGKPLYEKQPIDVQNYPFAMNKELYELIQNGNPYSTTNGQLYKGQSGKDLFDIQYVEQNNFFVTGPWYKVTLKDRIGIGVGTPNKVGEFMVDYFKTIRVVDTTNIMANIMEALSGAASIKANAGIGQIGDQTKFGAIVQRILGLCFDNRKEIDVSGIAKLADLDGVDESFFEFNEIDLRKIEQTITNIKNGVIEFEGCDNIKVPVNADAIFEDLNNLNFVSDNDLVDAMDNLTNSLINDPIWGLSPQIDVQAAVDFNFIKLMCQGIASSLLSPKILLPIYIMLKSLGQSAVDLINSFMTFIKEFKKFAINLISKVGAIFIEELFELIKRDIMALIQKVIADLIKEKVNKKLTMILKLVQLLLIVSSFISDWRRCKSVVDEILSMLSLITSGIPGFGGGIPLPLLFASQLLDGYSASRAFIGTIEEFQKIGVPTGSLPDGSPNLDLLSKFSQMKAMANEDDSNGKVEIAIGSLTTTPAGLTIPSKASGKKI